MRTVDDVSRVAPVRAAVVAVAAVFSKAVFFSAPDRKRMDYSVSFILKTVVPLLLGIVLCIRARRDRLSCMAAAVLLVVTATVVSVNQRAFRVSATHEGRQVPVGSGWSFYLNKEGLHGRPVFAPSGRQASGRWGAGTKIKELQMELAKRGLTLSAYPSIENATLGAWIASGSHGSGGTLWKPNFGQVLVRNLETDHEFVTDVNTIFHKEASIADCRRYLILEVEITAHPNVWCKVVADKMTTDVDYESFIVKPSYLRMLQIGQRGIMRILWLPLEAGDERIDHADPRPFSRTSLWLHSDILSILQSANAKEKDWFDFPVKSRENFTSRIRLADANRFTPEPGVLTSPIGLFWVNFEVFVLQYHATPEGLEQVCEVLRLLFETLWGRCELRLGANILFLDFNIVRLADARSVFELLHDLLHPHKIVLHRGKAQVDMHPF